MREGQIVQAGTPESLVAAPADDYVADFVRDVPKSHVLTLRGIMRAARPDDPLDGPEFPPETVIRAATHAAVASDRPIKVVEDGRVLGLVDRRQILSAIAGGDDESDTERAAAPAAPDADLDGGQGPP
jgi:glycine betaine/proline transport system ATP-binding protein